MNRHIPVAAYVLIVIVAAGLVMLAVLNPRLALILATPLQTPAAFCAAEPCINLGGIILNEPSSTALVYCLALVTIGVGVKFLRTADGQQARLWWGFSLLLTGIGAALAGTSYQAFGYELKCRGLTFCLWTSWWELAYMLCTVAGSGAAFAGVAAATLSKKAQKFWTAYAIASTGAYIGVLLAGLLLSDAFLLSFELMVAFAFAGGFVQVFVEDLWQYKHDKNPLIRQIVGVWAFLIVVIAVYFVALLANFASTLWANGIWFNENDVLHIGMVAWVIYGYWALKTSLRDAPE
jgi:hypothetical protein